MSPTSSASSTIWRSSRSSNTRSRRRSKACARLCSDRANTPRSLFVEAEGERVGFAIFFHNYSTFLGRPGLYLEDLYIRPEKRGQGYGKLLLRHLAGLAVARGCGRLEWWVLDWNRGAIDFYRSLGAEPMSDWTVFRLSGDALERLAPRSVD